MTPPPRAGTFAGDARRRSRPRRALALGFAVSALLHAALVAVYPFLAVDWPGGPASAPPPREREAEGVRVVALVERPADAVGEPEDPAEIKSPAEPDATVDAPDLEDRVRARYPTPPASAGERLRLSEGDPRLWAPVRPELVRPTPQQLMELGLHAALEAASDSALAEAERAASAMDWTRTDEQGRTWGLSPGTIHLGDVEVPLPFGFGPPPDYNGDRTEWAFRMADIDRARSSLAARRSWRERVEAMRVRREERRAAEEAERSGDARAKPDTTSLASRPRSGSAT